MLLTGGKLALSFSSCSVFTPAQKNLRTLVAWQWPLGAARAMAAAVVKVAVVFVGARHASIATSEKRGV